MHYRRLGRTNLELSEVGYGTWGLGQDVWHGAEDDQCCSRPSSPARTRSRPEAGRRTCRSPHGPSAKSLGGEVRDHAEMVGRPHAAHRFVEDALAGDDVERGSVVAAAHHYVVDSAARLQRPFTADYERIARR